MERRDALKTMLWAIGGLSIARPIRSASAAESARDLSGRGACWITPDETEGPFYFDPSLIRNDVREGRPGVLLALEIAVIDEYCNPRAGVMVDLWHCDKDGCYSGYNQVTCNAVGETFLRGTQITNASGVVNFTTIYPGWYPGRATHIHFKVRTASSTYKTSQFAFPEAANAAVYASPLYAAHGQNPTSNQQDGIFGSPEPLYETLEVTGDPTAGYSGTFTIGLAGDSSTDAVVTGGATGIRLAARPAPFRDEVTVMTALPVGGPVRLAIYDATGRRLRLLVDRTESAGTFEARWDGRDDEGRAVPAGVYFASLEAAGERAATRLVRVR